jgi:hypothetical protein
MTQPDPNPAPPPGDPAPTPEPTPTPAPSPPQDAGKGSERAVLADLAKERDKRQALEKQIAELAPLKQIADIITGGQKLPEGKSEAQLLNERLEKYEADLASEREARWRAEVAAEKGLTAQQAARLRGATRDELVADADELLSLFPATSPGPRTPAPDPSQGARGGQPGPDLQAQIDAARKAGDFKKAISLERQKLLSIPRPS